MPTRASRETQAALMKFGGFPEPFLAQSDRTLRRCQKERLERFFRRKLAIPWAHQVVLESDRDFVQDGVRCVPAHRFLAALA